MILGDYILQALALLVKSVNVAIGMHIQVVLHHVA